MKLTKAQMKKILMMSALIIFAVSAAGCRVATDETGAIKLITADTTFNEVMSEESWFAAILVWPMAQALNKLTPVIGVAGAIAVLTLVVNGILMIFTLKSTIATQQMQLLQPELDRIQKKYEGRTDDASKMKQANEMQALYKKYDVNPFSMILITFLQFPIIISIYQAVQRAEAVKTGTFCGLNLEITPLAGIKEGIYGYILLFIVMGVTQYLSMQLPQYLAKKKAEEDAAKHHRKPVETANSQNKMMQSYMLIMILVFGLMLPAAMSIYWIIYSVVNILKTLLTQKIIEDRNNNGNTKKK